MDISCRDDRFPELFSQFHDPSVEIEEVLFRFDLGIPVLHSRRLKKESVIIPGLDLQVIVEPGNSCYCFIPALFQQRFKQFS